MAEGVVSVEFQAVKSALKVLDEPAVWAKEKSWDALPAVRTPLGPDDPATDVGYQRLTEVRRAWPS